MKTLTWRTTKIANIMIDIHEGTDYNIVEREGCNLNSVKLLTGEWAGTIFTFGRVSIKEDKKTDTAVLSFDYRIEDESFSDHSKESLEANPRFKNYIGDILSSFLSESDYTIGKDGK